MADSGGNDVTLLSEVSSFGFSSRPLASGFGLGDSTSEASPRGGSFSTAPEGEVSRVLCSGSGDDGADAKAEDG